MNANGCLRAVEAVRMVEKLVLFSTVSIAWFWRLGFPPAAVSFVPLCILIQQSRFAQRLFALPLTVRFKRQLSAPVSMM